MTRGAATIAIVRARLARERSMLLLAVSTCVLLAYLQRYDDAPARLAGCLVFGTLIAIALSLLQRCAGRFPELELCEQSAPLYGRELARATAIVPCAVASLALAAYWSVSSLYALPAVSAVLLSVFAVSAATLVALCAGVQRGPARLFYVAAACTVPALAFLLYVTTPPLAALAVCALAAFAALRQYGEALARYSPI